VQVAAGLIKGVTYALGGDSTEAEKVFRTAGVQKADIDQQLQFFSINCGGPLANSQGRAKCGAAESGT
jgi:hypothetical protein